MRLPVSALLAQIAPPTALLLLAACGQPPVPVQTTKSALPPPQRMPDAARLPDGHPTGMTHPGMERAGASTATFTGTVRLEGELAQREGFLFVNVMPEGVRMPCYSRKFTLAEADPAMRMDGDTLVVDFVLDQQYELGGLVSGALVLEAVFDPDGYVDTKEPERVVASVATEAGDEGIELTLTR
ncbi:MAG: hypothetical protein WD226_11950 [Planctomycetota bacterium]